MRERGNIHAPLRLCGLFGLLCVVWVHGRLFCRGSLLQRGQWRQMWCQRIVRYLQLEMRSGGVLPQQGLVVANHISYLDVLVLGAMMPATFVAKKEVRGWPIIGACCAMGGTLYLDRESPRAVAIINRAIEDAFAQNVPVVIFPEGTTTAGDTLLPLHPALFHAAVKTGAQVTPAALSYTHDGGASIVRERIAYWGDMTLVPHLHSLMKLRGVHAKVHCHDGVTASSRVDAAAMSELVLRRSLQTAEAEQSGVVQELATA